MAIRNTVVDTGSLIPPNQVSLTPGSSLSLYPGEPTAYTSMNAGKQSGTYSPAAARSATPMNFDPAYNQDLATFQNSGQAQYLQQALNTLATSSGPQTPITIGEPSGSASLAASVTPPAPQGPVGKSFLQSILSLGSSGLIGGANPNQVPAAQQSQIYESAADDISNAVKAGMLTPIQGQEAIQAAAELGNQQVGETVANLAGNSNKNITNSVPTMDQVIQNESNALQNVNVPPVAFNTSALPGVFLNPSTPGWYSGSLSQGGQLATQLLSNLLNPSGGATGAAKMSAPAA